MSLLEIRNLTVEFGPADRPFAAVQGVDLSVERGELLGIVGESGSGKSVSMLALMGLVDAPGRVRADVLRFDGHDLLALSPRQRRELVGKDIAMIFQDPVASLNPSYTVGFQIAETLKVHQPGSRAQMRERALELLRRVEIPDAESRLSAFPHQLSGGMSQRVMIAMALACDPLLLIADEPTTALDVTIQAQILSLLDKLRRDIGMAVLFITHNLGVVAEIADRVVVMYCGRIVEEGSVRALFRAPRHPYTRGLLACLPRRALDGEGAATMRRLNAIPGQVASPLDPLVGCAFSPRCALADAQCEAAMPPLVEIAQGEHSRCRKWAEQ